MSTGWNDIHPYALWRMIINLLGNEYWLEPQKAWFADLDDYKPTGK